MPFDKVTLTLKKGPDGRYFVYPSPATVRRRAAQDFWIHPHSTPGCDCDDLPDGQPFEIGPSRVDPNNHTYRIADLWFIGALGDGSVKDWHRCFDGCEILTQAMDVNGITRPQTLEIDLVCAEHPKLALPSFRTVHAAASVAFLMLIGAFTVRFRKRPKPEQGLAEHSHTEGH